MKTTQATISGESINKITKYLSRIKKLDAERVYKLENIAKLNGRAAIFYAFHAQLLVKQQATINWMLQIIEFCQVYFQKYIIDNELDAPQAPQLSLVAK